MIILCGILIICLIAQTIFLVNILRQKRKLIKQSNDQTEKFHVFFDVTADWLIGNMLGEDISGWIIKNGYKTVAIYGMGVLGEALFFNLCKNENICIKYGLDQKKFMPIEGLAVYNLSEQLEQVDLVVVTVITEYEKIKSEIDSRIGFPCKVISLLQLVEEMFIET